MRAFTLESFDTPPALRDDFPEPRIAENEVLVRVHVSSVNPVDAFIAAGGLKEMAEHEFPVALGRDFAGVVEQVGSGVSRYRVGDEVFGFVLHANPTVRDGSWAELIAVPEDNMVAPKPRNVDFAEAGAAPLAAMAALAAFDGIAPALPEDHDYLRGLGVSELVDRNADLASVVRESHSDGVDAILDTVSFTP